MPGIPRGVLCLLCLFLEPVKPQLPFHVCTSSPCGEGALEACPEHVVDVIWGGMFCSNCQEQLGLRGGEHGWGAVTKGDKGDTETPSESMKKHFIIRNPQFL